MMLSTKSELFVAIAEEEQEVVAGGFGFSVPSIAAGQSSYYNASNLTAAGGVGSTPGGSVATGLLSLTKISTGANQGFNVYGIQL